MDYPSFTHIDVREHTIRKPIPWSETCFGCNAALPGGLGVRAYETEDDYIVGLCTPRQEHIGFPGITHGGILTVYFDEVLWHATRVHRPDTVAMTVEMAVHYLHPVHPGDALRVVALPEQVDGRHIYVDGYILLPDNSLACTARCHYVVVKSENALNEDEVTRIKHIDHTDLKCIVF